MTTKALTIPLATKLALCWEILTTGTIWNVLQRNQNDYIFRKGYQAGLSDQRLPGEYLVTVHVGTESSTEYKFDSLTAAVNFAKSVNMQDTGSYDAFTYAELEQTYLNRDMSDLLF